MKTKKFFTDVQNFWAPKTKNVFAEFENFSLSGILLIPEHCQEHKVLEVLNSIGNLK